MNGIFFDDLEKFGDRIALAEEDSRLTYAELSALMDEIARHVTPRSLIFCVCENRTASVAGYAAFLRTRVVPTLFNSSVDRELFLKLCEHYAPQYIWCPEKFINPEIFDRLTEIARIDIKPVYEYNGWKLFYFNTTAPAMRDDLALLLTTSGSTGSPKFVRQTYRNIQSNTESIVQYLAITPDDRAITTLPMSYTYGLSIIQSHLMAGARIILTERTLFDKNFWRLCRDEGATTFGGVPYTYQILDKLRFLRMDLPSLRYLTQAGGRLGAELHEKFASGLRKQGKAFIVMYGASEATARMSYVPAEYSVEKAGGIGIAIPGGRFELIDADGSVITGSDKIGELVYYGENVTLGYAERREDLNKPDERGGRLETGDMAKRDADGCYYVVGRKKRFLKIYGNRVNLAEIEDLLYHAGYEAACAGTDDHMRIFTTAQNPGALLNYISGKTGLNRAAFEIIYLDAIPRNASGKILYAELEARK